MFLGIDGIKKSDFIKRYDEQTKEYFYSEIEGGFSKNHRTDDEGRRSEKGGVIPLAVTDHGLNPGRFIEQVSEKMSENEFLFQRPRRESKHFDIDKPEVTTYFENSKVRVIRLHLPSKNHYKQVSLLVPTTPFTGKYY